MPASLPDAMLHPDLLRLFEELLAEARAVDKDGLLRELRPRLIERLPTGWHPRALGLLSRYIDLREALAHADAPDAGDPTALQRALDARDELRRRFFGPEEVVGLFGDEQRLDRFIADRMAIEHDPLLDAQARQDALAALEKMRLTPKEQSWRREAALALELERHTQFLRSSNATPQERFAERAQLYGPDAARRLATLDGEQAEWQRRLDEYTAADPERQQQLRHSLFSAQERLRLVGALGLRAVAAPQN